VRIDHARHAVGGASLIGSLINAGLVDELRLVVYPVVLTAGKALFGHVTERGNVNLLGVKALDAGRVEMRFALQTR
jgi:dihydrofolate reductase